MSGLARFRVDAEPVVEIRPKPELVSQAYCLAFDQTLAHTGWVAMVHLDDELRVDEAGLLSTPEDRGGGWEGNFRRALALHEQIRQVVARYPTVEWIAHETPISAGGHRAESAILAAFAVRMAACEVGKPVRMIARQRVTTLICGHGKVTKTQFAAALAECTWLGGQDLLTNEHKRDAAGIGVQSMTVKEAAKHAH